MFEIERGTYTPFSGDEVTQTVELDLGSDYVFVINEQQGVGSAVMKVKGSLPSILEPIPARTRCSCMIAEILETRVDSLLLYPVMPLFSSPNLRRRLRLTVTCQL